MGTATYRGRWFKERAGQVSRANGRCQLQTAIHPGIMPTPLCDIPSGCCSFTGPWTVTRSSLRMLCRVAAFWRPLRPVLLLVSFPRSWSPVEPRPPTPNPGIKSPGREKKH